MLRQDKMTTLSKAYFTAIILSFLSCQIWGCGSSQDEKTSKDTDKTAAPKKVSKKSESHMSDSKILEQIEQDVLAASDTQDWARVRQLVKRGLNIIGKNGPGLELNQARLLLELGNVEQEKGRENEARRHYADAMAIFHVHKNDKGRFKTYLALGRLDARRGDYAAAAKQFESADALMPEAKDTKLFGVFKIETGRLASRKVNHEKALEDFSVAIKIFGATRNHKLMAETLLLMAAEEDALNRPAASRKNLTRALNLFKEQENLDGEARSLHRLAAHAEREKKYQKARKLLQKVHALYEKLDHKSRATTVKRHINALPEASK